MIGGERDPDQRFLDLHVVTDVAGNDAIMLDEIFGPILPVVNAQSVDDAINFINAREKPLRLVYLSTSVLILSRNYIK